MDRYWNYHPFGCVCGSSKGESELGLRNCLRLYRFGAYSYYCPEPLEEAMTDVPPSRRSTDHIPADLEGFVHDTEERGRRIFIGSLVAISIIALTTAAAIFGLGFAVRYNHRIAVKANAKASRLQFQAQLAREKVCSQSSNRIVACRALFERLAGSLSPAQRIRLACEVLRHLDGPTADVIKKENKKCDLKENSP